jgi:hypothetical protein
MCQILEVRETVPNPVGMVLLVGEATIRPCPTAMSTETFCEELLALLQEEATRYSFHSPPTAGHSVFGCYPISRFISGTPLMLVRYMISWSRS